MNASPAIDRYLDLVEAVAPDDARALGFDFIIAGNRFRASSKDAGLLNQLSAAIYNQIVNLYGKPELTIAAWRGLPFPFDEAPPQWRVRERWLRREPVRASSERGMVFFDPVGGTVSLFDSLSRHAAIWFSGEGVLPVWIAAAPFLRILDAWFVRRGSVLCHAAAIAQNGSAALLVGAGGAGKSTLALRSLEAFFDYLGDDYVLLEPCESGATVHCVYASGKIARTDIDAWPVAHTSTARIADAAESKSFLCVDKRLLAQKAALSVLIAPCIGDLPGPRLEPISPAEAIRLLLPSTFWQLPGQEQRKLAFLSRAAGALPCFRLRLSRHASDNLDTISGVLAGQPQQRHPLRCRATA